MYFVPHVEALPAGIRSADLGAGWLAQHQDEGTPFILVSVRDHASNNETIQALTSGGVPWTIPRNFPPREWPGGPVLAPWANDKVIECIDRHSERITSVCVLKWLEKDNRAWLTARGAVDVTSPDRAPLKANVDDHVVLAAMQEITTIVNLSNNLATARDRTDAIRRLQYLKRWGHDLDAEQIASWALAYGWSQDGAVRLHLIIERINAGRSFRDLTWGPIRDRGALLRAWEQQADR